MRFRAQTYTNDVLLRRLFSSNARDFVSTAVMLDLIGVTDARRLYAPAGHPSMHAFCVAELNMSEDMAFNRITAARAAVRFPSILQFVARGRLHVTAVRMLAGHLTPENAEELLKAACGKTRSSLEALIARSGAEFAPPMLAKCHENRETQEQAAQQVECSPIEECLLVPERVESMASTPQPTPPEVWPEERVPLKVAVLRSTLDNLSYLQDLLSHSIPSGDVAAVLDHAIRNDIRTVENRRFAATPHPRATQRPDATGETRTIPARVRRAVWRRDHGKCTFVAENGRRCESRKFIEFDHVEPFALGGKATVDNTRLRCRTHNQYEADQVFGRDFMDEKRGRGETRR